MDFGDILDAWDRETAKAQGNKKRPKARDPGEEGQESSLPQRADPFSVWLRTGEIFDKDAALDAGKENSPGARRRRLLAKPADATIDLHGLTRDEAWTALETFFDTGRRQEFEKLLVIHGKGNHSGGEAVLKATVQRFIETCPFAGESGHGRAATGGNGATWVLLKEMPLP
jgi:DNA-nicking Smr family endonuclease